VLGKGWLEVRSKTSRFISDNRVGLASLATEGLGREATRDTQRREKQGDSAAGIYVILRGALSAEPLDSRACFVSCMELLRVSMRETELRWPFPRNDSPAGQTQSEAEALLAKFGIKAERQGDTSDSAIVVEHSPSNSLEIVSKKEVQTIGAGKERILKIRLYVKDAPASVRYFRVATGLELRRFGKLKTYFSTRRWT
jgi:UPF0288 family protein (methanogenesis marker protein 3)